MDGLGRGAIALHRYVMVLAWVSHLNVLQVCIPRIHTRFPELLRIHQK